MAEFLELAAVGERPAERRDGPRPPHAARAMARTVRIDSNRVTWRTRLGRPGAMPVAEVAQVVLVEAVYASVGAGDAVVPYALVIDQAGAVRLRVAPGASRGATTTERRRRVRSVWEDAGLSVTSGRRSSDAPRTTAAGGLRRSRSRTPIR